MNKKYRPLKILEYTEKYKVIAGKIIKKNNKPREIGKEQVMHCERGSNPGPNGLQTKA